jgi:hypothetical protein
MSTPSIGISPGPSDTRVIAMAGPSDTILKARLSRQPSHPRALPTLLEAIALWQGVQVHAIRAYATSSCPSDPSARMTLSPAPATTTRKERGDE